MGNLTRKRFAMQETGKIKDMMMSSLTTRGRIASGIVAMDTALRDEMKLPALPQSLGGEAPNAPDENGLVYVEATFKVDPKTFKPQALENPKAQENVEEPGAPMPKMADDTAKGKEQVLNRTKSGKGEEDTVIDEFIVILKSEPDNIKSNPHSKGWGRKKSSSLNSDSGITNGWKDLWEVLKGADDIAPNANGKFWGWKKRPGEEEEEVVGAEIAESIPSMDEAPKDSTAPKGGNAAKKEQTLAEHDRQFHPHGYDPKTDTCALREAMNDEDDMSSEEPSEGAAEAAKAQKAEREAGVRREVVRDKIDEGATGNIKEADEPKATPIGHLSAKKVKEYRALMEKKHPELDADEVLEEVGKIEDRQLRGDAFKWVLRGAVRLPEDMYKVEQARSLAKKAKKDPFAYETPQACINELQGLFHRDEKNAITMEELRSNPLISDYQDLGNGVETIRVDDSQEGQQLMREVLNSHFGKDFSPWCLLQSDGHGGCSDQSWGYWSETYNGLPKRMAFKDGKPIAFAARRPADFEDDEDLQDDFPALYDEYNKWYDSEEGQEEGASFGEWLQMEYPYIESELPTIWWDLSDSPHREGIPLGLMPIEGDELGRSCESYMDAEGKVVHYEYERPEKIDENGKRTVWFRDSMQKMMEVWPDGSEKVWHKSGELQSERFADGSGQSWYENGQKESEWLPDDTVSREWHENGVLKHEYVDGYNRYWNDKGTLIEETNIGKNIHKLWNPNGNLFSEMVEVKRKDGHTELVDVRYDEKDGTPTGVHTKSWEVGAWIDRKPILYGEADKAEFSLSGEHSPWIVTLNSRGEPVKAIREIRLSPLFYTNTLYFDDKGNITRATSRQEPNASLGKYGQTTELAEDEVKNMAKAYEKEAEPLLSWLDDVRHLIFPKKEPSIKEAMDEALAFDAGIKKAPTAQSIVDKKHVDTPISQCKAKNPFYCRYHGPKLIETEIKYQLSVLRKDASSVQVLRDTSSKSPTTFKVVIGCSPKARKTIEEWLQDKWLKQPGITPLSTSWQAGKSRGGTYSQYYEIDEMRADKAPKGYFEQRAAALNAQQPQGLLEGDEEAFQQSGEEGDKEFKKPGKLKDIVRPYGPRRKVAMTPKAPEEETPKAPIDGEESPSPKNVAQEGANPPIDEHKRKQFEIIQATNPMRDEYHTGIRSVEDIKTFQEAIDDEAPTYPDITKEVLDEALRSGKITVYSSTPIKDGAFVSPSKKCAQDYAGKSGDVYSQELKLEDIAWINGDEGQVAIVNKEKPQSSEPEHSDEDRDEESEAEEKNRELGLALNGWTMEDVSNAAAQADFVASNPNTDETMKGIATAVVEAADKAERAYDKCMQSPFRSHDWDENHLALKRAIEQVKAGADLIKERQAKAAEAQKEREREGRQRSAARSIIDELNDKLKQIVAETADGENPVVKMMDALKGMSAETAAGYVFDSFSQNSNTKSILASARQVSKAKPSMRNREETDLLTAKTLMTLRAQFPGLSGELDSLREGTVYLPQGCRSSRKAGMFLRVRGAFGGMRFGDTGRQGIAYRYKPNLGERAPIAPESLFVGNVFCREKTPEMKNRNVMCHELGHFIYWGDIKLQQAWTNAVNNSEFAGWNAASKSIIKNRVSIYAATNKDELHSECFAMMTSGFYKPGMLPKSIEDYFNREILHTVK